MSSPDPRLAMLARMREPALELGCAVAEAAKASVVGDARFFGLTELYLKCFAAVRLSIALELRLEREARLASRAAPDGPLAGRDADLEPTPEPERLDSDLAGERERETASFPLLLRTLEGVVDEAASLVTPEPAELPTLRDLMARLQGPRAEAPARPSRDLRARLSGSASVAVLPRPVLTPSQPGGRATGPPRG
ncbi:MAG: hypothetical protein JNK30_10730 [Phenylobacterium sp.]|uniref:hypothetical protein n=1 Tax=Phenylobacterium sp. TaxID=1871053 RepID=UPI001A3BFB60|nr:hypothetical protein [Phenylobacterium sp.]MBL8771845.1 hypothetical protein [Phenylobacterium sp.]